MRRVSVRTRVDRSTTCCCVNLARFKLMRRGGCLWKWLQLVENDASMWVWLISSDSSIWLSLPFRCLLPASSVVGSDVYGPDIYKLGANVHDRCPEVFDLSILGKLDFLNTSFFIKCTFVWGSKLFTISYLLNRWFDDCARQSIKSVNKRNRLFHIKIWIQVTQFSWCLSNNQK